MLRSMAFAQGIPCIVYLHPWELDSFKPEVGLSATTSVRSQGGQATMPIKLEQILRQGDFETLEQYVGRLRSTNDLQVVTTS